MGTATLRWTGLVAVAMLLAACATEELPGVRSGRRVVVIGLAGLDSRRVQVMLAEGRLPHLAALQARGATGRVAAAQPPLPPLLWTTLATGRTPDVHGVLEFEAPVADHGDRSGAGTRPRVKTLWEFAGDAGLATATIGWWSTWPAGETSGVVVSDRWAESLGQVGMPGRSGARTAGLVAPVGLLDRINAAGIAPENLGIADLERFLPLSGAQRGFLAGDEPRGGDEEENLLLDLRRMVAAARSVESATALLMAEQEMDLVVVGFDGIDQAQHLFARFEEPAMPGTTNSQRNRYGGVVESFYRYLDEVVGRLVAMAGPEAAVVVVSTHGFVQGAARPMGEPAGVAGRAMLWHDGPGVIFMAGEPFSVTDLGKVRLEDVVPTILAVLGLPVAEDLAGSPLRGALTGNFLAAHPVTTTSSYERIGSRSSGAGREPADAAFLSSLSPGALVNLGMVLAYQGQIQSSREAYEAALAREPDSTVAHLGFFHLMDSQGTAEEALAAGMDCLARSGHPPAEVYTRVAWLWAEAGSVEAGRDLLEAHPGRPGAAGPWLARAVLAEADGEDEAAVDALGRALERETGSWDVAQALVSFHERRDQLQAAIPALRRGLAARGGDSLPHLVALGYCALAADDLGAAGDYLGRAVEIAPRQEEALYYLGSVHFRSGRFSDAVSMWSRLVDVAPGHDDGRANLILALARTGRIARALEVFRAAGPESRETTRLLNAAASACLLNGLPEEGLLLARRSLMLAPDDAAARELVAALQSESAGLAGEQP